jgi:myo-inositol-1(or 4)-monophosphatase
MSGISSPDLDLAEQAVRAGAAAALERRRGALQVREKTAATDLVTDADDAAEAAIAALLRAERPDDGLHGEEGARGAAAAAEAGGRRWLIDPIDGTLAFAAGVHGWSVAVALEDAAGPLVAAVLDPLTGELFTAERGAGCRVDGRPARVRPARPLHDAVVATYLHPARRPLPGVLPAAHALLDATGILRSGGSGTLELAWVATGRIDGWAQPAVEPWDWAPGSLLVREAGGRAEVVGGATPWHVAGAAGVVEGLARVVRAG